MHRIEKETRRLIFDSRTGGFRNHSEPSVRGAIRGGGSSSTPSFQRSIADFSRGNCSFSVPIFLEDALENLTQRRGDAASGGNGEENPDIRQTLTHPGVFPCFSTPRLRASARDSSPGFPDNWATPLPFAQRGLSLGALAVTIHSRLALVFFA